MKNEISKLRFRFGELFGTNHQSNSYIQIGDYPDEIVLSANKEGLLLLIEQLLMICDDDSQGVHYHLDEQGIVDKCDKPMVISVVSAPW